MPYKTVMSKHLQNGQVSFKPFEPYRVRERIEASLCLSETHRGGDGVFAEDRYRLADLLYVLVENGLVRAHKIPIKMDSNPTLWYVEINNH